jgi:hypothetical protein
MARPIKNTRPVSALARLGATLLGSRSHLGTRAALAAVLLVVSSLLALQFNPKVGSEAVPGLVLEIEALGLEPAEAGTGPQSRVLIAVGDSSQTHILLPPPVPLPGHFIPLKAEYFRRGNVEYSLDMKKWLAEGPS